jgi:hypothetical protein
MKVAWLSHQLPREEGSDNGPRMLPGKYPGGAEMGAERRIQAAPVGVEVTTFHPDEWEQCLDFDQIIIGATDLLTDNAMNALAVRKPVVTVAHPQIEKPSRARLFESATIFIGFTPSHVAQTTNWCIPKRTGWAISPMNPDDYWTEEKQLIALHAARDDAYKGKDNAIRWAEDNGIPLTLMHTQPHQVVKQAMAISKYFVHLPHSLDAEPGAVIEATLSNCELIVNDYVGFTSVPFWQDREQVAIAALDAANKFWGLALG